MEHSKTEQYSFFNSVHKCPYTHNELYTLHTSNEQLWKRRRISVSSKQQPSAEFKTFPIAAVHIFLCAWYMRLFFIQGHCHVIANNLFSTAFYGIFSLCHWHRTQKKKNGIYLFMFTVYILHWFIEKYFV